MDKITNHQCSVKLNSYTLPWDNLHHSHTEFVRWWLLEENTNDLMLMSQLLSYYNVAMLVFCSCVSVATRGQLGVFLPQSNYSSMCGIVAKNIFSAIYFQFKCTNGTHGLLSRIYFMYSKFLPKKLNTQFTVV